MRTSVVRLYTYESLLSATLFFVMFNLSFAGTRSTEINKDAYLEVVDKAANLEDGSEALKQKIDYPRAAFLARFEGRVIAKVYLDETGKVDDVEFVKKIGGGFETSIKRAIMDTKFTPAIHNEKPVKSVAVLSFKFQLDNK